MTTWKYPIELYDKQKLAVSSPADQVLFGGSLAGGKTEMILKHLVDIAASSRVRKSSWSVNSSRT